LPFWETVFSRKFVVEENPMGDSSLKRDSKDPMQTAKNSARQGGGNEPYPQGAEGHGDGSAEHVTASQNRTTGKDAMAVKQPTRQNGDGNVPVVGEDHNQRKAEHVTASQRW
jgi:hypothetical protein